MRILFAATGDIAIPTLETLNSLGLLGGVLTAPDKRGKREGYSKLLEKTKGSKAQNHRYCRMV